MKALPNAAGEIKSMRTHAAYLRQGVGEKILKHIMKIARTRGYDRLYLETGSGGPFEAAVQLYCKNGFVSCNAFGSYTASEFNQFMCLDL
jgi:putative acetyltransferase